MIDRRLISDALLIAVMARLAVVLGGVVHVGSVAASVGWVVGWGSLAVIFRQGAGDDRAQGRSAWAWIPTTMMTAAGVVMAVAVWGRLWRFPWWSELVSMLLGRAYISTVAENGDLAVTTELGTVFIAPFLDRVVGIEFIPFMVSFVAYATLNGVNRFGAALVLLWAAIAAAAIRGAMVVAWFASQVEIFQHPGQTSVFSGAAAHAIWCGALIAGFPLGGRFGLDPASEGVR